ncbi:DUF4382 domain-containing protein [Halolamina sp.]|jgi:hypothetical protein|uniref:DUF4382 domain-containing protein n=1 Tax=Halolamina sp. TaxID=1940283 RepID=UPI000223BACD|nr:hypothetical protein Halar_2971 [halophilic archaeon DL31]
MQRQTVATVLAAAMLLVAGCGSGVSPGDSSGETGTVNMYISDQQNAIDQFDHLTVTVTSVAAHRVDDPDTEANESGWVEQEIDNVTVDLTELQGENASKLGAIEAPNGTYNKVFVHVDSDINATLADGSSQTVKLPSNKLRLNTEFTVGNGEEIDFVFDMTVFERGNGDYILKPVAGESGPDKAFTEKPSAKAGNQSGADDADDEETDSETDAAAQGNASLDFYVSDEQNAISEFEHLNVTIQKVGVHRADDGDETESAWVEKDVTNTTVDLTELQGANASKLSTLAVENGTYDKAFVSVSEVNGTLTNGETTDVKLPSSKLKIKTQFTVGNGEAVDFVFDITVVKRGNSGSYNIKPVVGQSGTSDQVEIEEKDDKPEDAEENETEENESEEETEQAALELALDGNATAGENVTVTVTQNGSAVAGAVVTANGEAAGETDANGTITVAVPSDAEELELEATSDEAEGELTVTVEQSGDATTESGTATGTASESLAAPAL